MHLINGDSAAGTFRQAYHLPRDAILVFRDVLSCGELKEYTDMQKWYDYRSAYWSLCFHEHGFGAVDESDKMPRDFYCHLDELKNEKQIDLWIGCALSDQLLLVFVVMLFDHYRLDFSKLNIHQYLTFDKKNLTVGGVGLLSPDNIKKLAPKPHTLNEVEISYCLSVWQAITTDTPIQLTKILSDKNTPMPLLFKALQNLLYRYPDMHTGLSYFDELILKQSKERGPKAARVIGYTMAHDMRPEDGGNIHELDMVGDIYLFARLKRLAKLDTPLLALDVMNKSLRETTVQVTDFGSEVLEGKHNVIEVNGIDDWVGGVHLSAGNIWFQDGKAIVSP